MLTNYSKDQINKHIIENYSKRDALELLSKVLGHSKQESSEINKNLNRL